MADLRDGRGHRAFRRQREALKARAIREGLTHCPGCGHPFEFDPAKANSKHAFTSDHPVPIARGGALVGQQLVPLCRSCNAKKGSVGPPRLRRAT